MAGTQAAPWSIPWTGGSPFALSILPPNPAEMALVLHLFIFLGVLMKPAFSLSPINLLKVLLLVMVREGCVFGLWEEQGGFELWIGLQKLFFHSKDYRDQDTFPCWLWY